VPGFWLIDICLNLLFISISILMHILHLLRRMAVSRSIVWHYKPTPVNGALLGGILHLGNSTTVECCMSVVCICIESNLWEDNTEPIVTIDIHCWLCRGINVQYHPWDHDPQWLSYFSGVRNHRLGAISRWLISVPDLAAENRVLRLRFLSDWWISPAYCGWVISIFMEIFTNI
jgi:hypothetical protein